MVNGDKFSIIAEVLNSVARVYGWKDFYKPTFRSVYQPSKDTLTKYAGNYLLGTDTIAIKFCGDQLCVWQNGEPSAGLKLIFSNSTTCNIVEIPNASIRMLFKDGKVSSFELQQGGGKFIANKVD
jgi:hypothetical protein